MEVNNIIHIKKDFTQITWSLFVFCEFITLFCLTSNFLEAEKNSWLFKPCIKNGGDCIINLSQSCLLNRSHSPCVTSFAGQSEVEQNEKIITKMLRNSIQKRTLFFLMYVYYHGIIIHNKIMAGKFIVKQVDLLIPKFQSNYFYSLLIWHLLLLRLLSNCHNFPRNSPT